ncbi:MAG: type IV pilus assembly protein [Geobacteraceae bacterium]|nr:MAG: type IV pilus assembly protein [Geobacteraceae bacterium]
MQLKINLATKTYINTQQLNWSIVAAVALLGLMLFLNVRDIATNAGEIKRVAKEIAVLTGKSAGEKGVSEQEYQAILARIRFANSIIDKKTFNWLTLLDQLESSVPDGIALTSIEPVQKESALKLTGSARNFNNLRSFMENLENSKSFTEVYLVSQAETKVGATQKGITFNITCKAGIK